ncbi:MAG: DUF3572 domain-containing protein [Xanthobacteraceae bacterium]
MELRTRSTGKTTPADAEALALAALSFLAADPERLGTFLAETGLGPENVRAAAGTPGFLPAVLDYLIGHEAVLVEFATEHGLDPAKIAAARSALPSARRDV